MFCEMRNSFRAGMTELRSNERRNSEKFTIAPTAEVANRSKAKVKRPKTVISSVTKLSMFPKTAPA